MKEWRSIEDYKAMLSLMGSLSKLYSDSDIPFIHYRITENLFCKYCNAKNLSRDDTAYDAKIETTGIGIKTFTLKNGRSVEKIAEFDKLSPQLKDLKGESLALKLAEFRNERMLTANSLYNIDSSTYHIIGRSKGCLEVFDSPYDIVDKSSINIISESDKSLRFSDCRHTYSFSRSKSVLMKLFEVPDDRILLPVEIIDDPYALLKKLLDTADLSKYKQKPDELRSIPLFDKRRENSIVLPLFTQKRNGDVIEKFVPEKSGLNQWNASGRPRDCNEVYIPIPMKVHKEYPGFFPDRDTPFTLHLPNGEDILSAKICQDNGKALMTNPNKALGEWILRKVLRLKEGTLLTYDRLLEAGFDSLRITKIDEENYLVNVTEENFSYETSGEE